MVKIIKGTEHTEGFVKMENERVLTPGDISRLASSTNDKANLVWLTEGEVIAKTREMTIKEVVEWLEIYHSHSILGHTPPTEHFIMVRPVYEALKEGRLE